MGPYGICIARVGDDIYASPTVQPSELATFRRRSRNVQLQHRSTKHGSTFSLKTAVPVPAGDGTGRGLPGDGRRRRGSGERPLSELVIEGLRASVGGKEKLRGVDLTVASGQVHRSWPERLGEVHSFPRHCRPSRVRDHLGHDHPGRGRPTCDASLYNVRARALPRPAVPDRSSRGELARPLGEAFTASGRDAAKIPALLADEARSVGFDESFLSRPLNVDLSGERKRDQVLQLGVADRASRSWTRSIPGSTLMRCGRWRGVSRARTGRWDRRTGDNPLPAAPL